MLGDECKMKTLKLEMVLVSAVIVLLNVIGSLLAQFHKTCINNPSFVSLSQAGRTVDSGRLSCQHHCGSRNGPDLSTLLKRCFSFVRINYNLNKTPPPLNIVVGGDWARGTSSNTIIKIMN